MPRASHSGDKPARAATSGIAAPRRRKVVSDAELDAYAEQVVDALPPLTDTQRDLLALIFNESRRRLSAQGE